LDIDLESPDHTTLSRRSQRLNAHLHRVAGDNPIHLIVDSTGFPSAAKGNGLPLNMEGVADVAGRSFTSVLIERA